MTHNFQPWPKIARLNRDIVITEKIDGTNAAIGIERISDSLAYQVISGRADINDLRQVNTTTIVEVELTGNDLDQSTVGPRGFYWVWAQSRNRVITPGKSTDNSGFAGWVAEHADVLVELLGTGLHFGEWWGRGIQRGYEQQGKRFSLFNTNRYAGVGDHANADMGDGTYLDTVPVLYQGPFGEFHIQAALNDLELSGSKAAPGFMRPEGIIVYHTASGVPFKVTIEGDEAPKGVQRG